MMRRRSNDSATKLLLLANQWFCPYKYKRRDSRSEIAYSGLADFAMPDIPTLTEVHLFRHSVECSNICR
jgi:hypothetical protein